MGLNSIFCYYTEGKAIKSPDGHHPHPRPVTGNMRVFCFGHLYPRASESGLEAYRFEIDSALTRFAFDSEDYREWRRRESYRKARRDPGPRAGFVRECVHRDRT